MIQRWLQMQRSTVQSLKSTRALFVSATALGAVSLVAMTFTEISVLKIGFRKQIRQSAARIHHVDASWVGGGQTIPQLVHGSVKTGLIATGTFVKKMPAAEKNGSTYTSFSSKIAKVLYGSADKSVIIVHQTGGKTGLLRAPSY